MIIALSLALMACLAYILLGNRQHADLSIVNGNAQQPITGSKIMKEAETKTGKEGQIFSTV